MPKYEKNSFPTFWTTVIIRTYSKTLNNAPKTNTPHNIIQLNLFKLNLFFNNQRLPKTMTTNIIKGLIISYTNAIISPNKNTDIICSNTKNPSAKQIDFKTDFDVILGFKTIKKQTAKAT